MRLLLVPVLLVLSTPPLLAQLDGAFTLRATDNADRINLNLVYDDGGRSNYGRTMERSALIDLVNAGEKITFAIRREPGTFTFDGRGTIERASGWYGFTPNQAFRSEMEKLGYRDIEPKHQFVFALDDLTVAKAKQLQQLVANRLDTLELVRLINHGAGFSYVQAMSDLGFKNLASDQYRRARDHGVSETFVREMATLGMKLPLEDLIRLRDHGVTPDYVRSMRSAGFQVSHQELVRARDHGVTPEFLRRMRELGHDKLPLDEYIRMRDHGVTPDFIESMREVGYSGLSAAELVRLRDHGVTAGYVRQLKEVLKESPSVEQLIRMRSRGEIVAR